MPGRVLIVRDGGCIAWEHDVPALLLRLGEGPGSNVIKLRVEGHSRAESPLSNSIAQRAMWEMYHRRLALKDLIFELKDSAEALVERDIKI
jgi:hypothetical protein